MEGTATWYGLTDTEGRRKPAYYALSTLWTNRKQKSPLHDVHIKGPSEELEPGKTYEFKAITENNISKTARYQWYLCENEYLDRTGKVVQLAGGMRAKVTFPKEPSKYRLYLYIHDGKGNVVTASEPVPVSN
ncbi:hypothetical protein GXP67_33425 [Rhodocytophaga rosea]|uniref:Uncharacterized protein n=1 Tax=Rhodocytophaga rosea TaxID=2704465 RepID=A0A6C0GT60_9BACT|nr:hypothetical protein [Rhodocytophaga rosea]QHT71206.1 hypothetical protein GXP67_33425 [Rhodocytophaga rosea]